jgi:hypothetical protein
MNLQKVVAAKQREIAKSRNDILISRETAEQDSYMPILETNYCTTDNPGLKRAKVIKQVELERDQMNLH